jgi:hypothetical protein
MHHPHHSQDAPLVPLSGVHRPEPRTVSPAGQTLAGRFKGKSNTPPSEGLGLDQVAPAGAAPSVADSTVSR